LLRHSRATRKEDSGPQEVRGERGSGGVTVWAVRFSSGRDVVLRRYGGHPKSLRERGGTSRCGRRAKVHNRASAHAFVRESRSLIGNGATGLQWSTKKESSKRQ